jgi:hypothetical protein
VKPVSPVLYPFLAAMYPVLTLGAANSDAVLRLGVLTRPIGISMLVCVSAWLAFGLLVRNRDRLALATLGAVIIFASYGYFIEALEGVSWAAPFASTGLPLVFMVVYMGAALWLVFRTGWNLGGLTRYLNIVTVALVLWNTTLLLGHFLSHPAFHVRPRSPAFRANASRSDNGTPDIYLIVLDKYTGSHSLKLNFGFDNTRFENTLRQMGFVLPRHPHPNYIHTFLSLASLLNYRYLGDVPAKVGPRSRDQSYVNELVENNAAVRFLQAHNYRFIFFPTTFAVTQRNRLADIQVPDPSQVPAEFESVWLSTTLAAPILHWACKHDYCGQIAALFTTESPDLIDWKFGQLQKLPSWTRDGRPLFVFAHITIPHEPYIFNADCTRREPLVPPRFAPTDEGPERQAYIAQLTCVNQRVQAVVERILKDSPRPPVVLLQSDHGHGRMFAHIPDLSRVTPNRIAERADIFAAYYLPGVDPSIIYDSITSVNVFRTVFRAYFGAPLDRLPDETYWSPTAHPLQSTRVERRGGADPMTADSVAPSLVGAN